jgi:peroxiredoxin
MHFHARREGAIMHARLLRVAAIWLAAWVFGGSRAGAIEPGRQAPAFELPFMSGVGAAASSGIFAAHEYTFLVFWHSSCPRCVESLSGCERFYRTYGGEDIAVLGINTDERDRLAARGAVEANAITFPQAFDEGAMVSSGYGVPFGAFALVLVGKGGGVLAVRYDPEGDAGAAMEEMLRQGESPGEERAATRDLPPAREAGRGFAYRGLQRVRVLAIDAHGADATGLYGEPVTAERSVLYRLEIEGSLKLARHLRAGGLLRIGNEGAKVLASGPDYYGSEWGSAFAELRAAAVHARVGYYTLSMTPFTLMRWDWDDNPRIGGDTGCGCGAGPAGAFLVESLEELGPDLTFEGALAEYASSGVEARLFYAIPRRAIETSYSAYRFGGAERARYSQEIAGAELVWQRLDRRTGLFWKAGAHAIGSFENKRSVDFSGLDYLAADPWTDTRTLSFTAEAPLARHARLRGEIIAWNDTKERGVATVDGLVDYVRRGGGGLGGIVIEKPLGPALLVDFLRLSRGFSTPYAALSYEENTEGVRASTRAPFASGRLTVSLFYKRLREADLAPSASKRKQISLAGASLDVGIRGSLGAGLGWVEKKMWRDEDAAIPPLNAYRRGLVGELHYGFETYGDVRLRYERSEGTGTAFGVPSESGSDMYSLYSSIEF